MKAVYNEDKEKTCEDKARELSGYDDAALLREAAAAEREWQQEKESHPERAAELEQAADLNFEILMSRLNSKGLKPISERRYNRRQKWENFDVTKIRKINRKVVILAAVAAVLMIGGSIGVLARSGYQYSAYPEQNSKSRLIRSNVAVSMLDDDIEHAYDIISDKIGIPVMILGYMPEGMQFDKVTFNENGAIIELKYDGKHFFLKESKPDTDIRVDVLVSDRKGSFKIENFWLNRTLYIEENNLENGTIEYSVNVETEKGYYYFSGIIKRDEFVAIAENLMYQKTY